MLVDINAATMMGIPVVFWFLVMLGGIAGFYAGQWAGYRAAIKELVVPLRDRMYGDADRLRHGVEAKEDPGSAHATSGFVSSESPA